jgi:hypothetical protein
VQVLSKSRRAAVKNLKPGRLLQKACGLDIVKKAASRKGRVLLLFHCQIMPIEGGQLVRHRVRRQQARPCHWLSELAQHALRL